VEARRVSLYFGQSYALVGCKWEFRFYASTRLDMSALEGNRTDIRLVDVFLLFYYTRDWWGLLFIGDLLFYRQDNIYFFMFPTVFTAETRGPIAHMCEECGCQSRLVSIRRIGVVVALWLVSLPSVLTIHRWGSVVDCFLSMTRHERLNIGIIMLGIIFSRRGPGFLSFRTIVVAVAAAITVHLGVGTFLVGFRGTNSHLVRRPTGGKMPSGLVVSHIRVQRRISTLTMTMTVRIPIGGAGVVAIVLRRSHGWAIRGSWRVRRLWLIILWVLSGMGSLVLLMLLLLRVERTALRLHCCRDEFARRVDARWVEMTSVLRNKRSRTCRAILTADGIWRAVRATSVHLGLESSDRTRTRTM
jgi:hypothetical protein